jgi:hypothetical protein
MPVRPSQRSRGKRPVAMATIRIAASRISRTVILCGRGSCGFTPSILLRSVGVAAGGMASPAFVRVA